MLRRMCTRMPHALRAGGAILFPQQALTCLQDLLSKLEPLACLCPSVLVDCLGFRGSETPCAGFPRKVGNFTSIHGVLYCYEPTRTIGWKELSVRLLDGFQNYLSWKPSIDLLQFYYQGDRVLKYQYTRHKTSMQLYEMDIV